MIDELRKEINGYSEGLIVLLPKLMIAFILLIIFIIVGSLIGRLVRNWIAPRMRDPLLAKFIARTIKFLIVVLGIIAGLNVLGLVAVAASLMAGAGVTAIILGFAFRDIGENLLAGVMLAFSRPFKVGDTVETGNIIGRIVSMTLRNIQIKTPDGKDVFIPNANIVKNPLINYTIDGFLRFDFIVGIDFNADVLQASAIIKKTIKEMEGVLHSRNVDVLIKELAPSTVNLQVMYWINTFDTNVNGGLLKTAIMNKVKVALLENNISLPADIVELKIYDEESPIPLRVLDKN